MSSIERIAIYTNNVIPEESVEETQQGLEYEKSAVSWPPTNGVIAVNNVNFRYRQGPLVLKNVTFDTAKSEKLGIAGRTGSGKSSLIGAIFRMEPIDNGTITVDGVNIHSLPVKHYRKQLGIIPQFPNLFSASIRFNLDPFSEYSDAQIWDALEKVELKNVIGNMEQKLDEVVAEGGENFSSGQRQLISFARVILRKPKILILDEATSNTDNTTDGIIQNMIRTEFPSCTILTVAHRLQTIADSDRILVLKDGEVAQLGPPTSLLAEGNGVFHEMWQSMISSKG
jgi:ATP-binding cassette subfamily C (CFTR/MRP) protein 1